MAQNAQLKAQIRSLLKRIEELEKQLGLGGDPPAKPLAVKASAPPPQKHPRRKRGGAHFRRVETPTERVDHVPDLCPDCGRGLSGGGVHHTRQIIDIHPAPAQVVEHALWRRYCGVCQREVIAQADFSDQVLGKRRIGLNLTSWIATLHIEARIPIRTLQRLLASLFDVHVSTGEMVDLLDAVARKAEPVAAAQLEEARGSSYAHADETSWREGGQSGYLWSLSTPAVRHLRYRKSRAGAVAQELVGEEFDGTLVSDFYCGYNCLACRHQRCWVHFARDLHKLREEHKLSGDPKLRGDPVQDGANTLVHEWVDAVLDVWRRAKAYQARCRAGGCFDTDVFARRRWRQNFERELYALAAPVLEEAAAPHKTLAGRIGLFLSELFTFVEYPEVPSDNNPAERAVRGAVIARKVRGGTRSSKGSATWCTLMSVFSTWRLRDLDVAAQCKALLQQTA